jgi:hypothetical protein
MAARTKSKVTPKYKTKYRVRNWAAYEESLRRRGDITVWFDAHAVGSWNARPTGRPGGQREYSDVAIETALTLRSLFHLGLRQTKGCVGSLIRLMGLELRVPDHTTLSRRCRTVQVRSLPRTGAGPLHLVIDSTGLKVVGGGQWNADKHGDSKKRRQWRKLHLGIDLGGFIVVSALTARSRDDGCVGVELLGRLGAPVASFRADGAYDTRAGYASLDEVRADQIDIAIPPRRTASSARHGVGTWRQREAALLRIDAVGRRRWRKESGANQQARAENGMYRFKQILGPRLRSRSEEGQQREAMIGVNILNRMTELGMPESVAVRT